ncbi:hypothetical protein CRUP_027430 [Coryphaenoides rupestris]|nr:hypothetical protein CRUP_027430 [Coryphaenoides rupestris]
MGSPFKRQNTAPPHGPAPPPSPLATVVPSAWWPRGSSSRRMNMPSSSAWQPPRKRSTMEERAAADALPWNLLPPLLRRRPNRILERAQREERSPWGHQDDTTDVAAVLPLGRQHSLLNVITVVVDKLGHLVQAHLPRIMQIVLCISASVSAILDRREQGLQQQADEHAQLLGLAAPQEAQHDGGARRRRRLALELAAALAAQAAEQDPGTGAERGTLTTASTTSPSSEMLKWTISSLKCLSSSSLSRFSLGTPG